MLQKTLDLDSLFFWDMDYEIAFPGTFVDGIRSLVNSGTAAILGYGYKDVQEIFTDIGIERRCCLSAQRRLSTLWERLRRKELLKS